MNKVLIFQALYSFVVEDIVSKMNNIPSEEDIDVYLNSPGGSVFGGWTIAAEFPERKGKVHMKVRGHAASMAPMLIALSDTSEALDVTMFMLHRASMYSPSEEEKKTLATINKTMFSKLSAKIDDDALFALKGIRLKEIFEAEEQKDIWLTAKEAKKIGLIDKVVKLEKKQAQAEALDVAAYYDEFKSTEVDANHKLITNENSNKMNLEQLKKDHPGVFAEAKGIGFKAGVAEERDRSGAWLAFNDIDPEAVSKGIKGGESMTQSEMAEMSRKALDANYKQGIEAEAAPVVETEAVKKAESEKEANMTSFMAEVVGNKKEDK